MSDLQSAIKEKAQQQFDYMVQVRRHLHKNPEVSFKEHDTTKFIAGELESMGIEVHHPLETGCVGVIEGGKKSERVIALRADIDALAMDEEGEAKKEFMSERPGAAHCCGHDAHTANLLGTARILTELQDNIEGKVLLVFQPGEEKLPGGGRLLSETGFLQDQGVQRIYGLHTSPNYKPGEIATRPGPLMANTVEFEITLEGKGGHAATPHLTVDPIVMLGDVISRFQTIVSRSVDPVDSAVVTIGRVNAGSTYNVIPAKAELIGTVRSFSSETTELIRNRMEQILKGVTDAVGGGFKFQFNVGYPALINDYKAAETILETGKKLLGNESVLELNNPLLAGEDFSFYLNHFPGAFFYLGTGSDEADSKWSWHHPRYNIDERGLLIGAEMMAGIGLNI